MRKPREQRLGVMVVSVTGQTTRVPSMSIALDKGGSKNPHTEHPLEVNNSFLKQIQFNLIYFIIFREIMEVELLQKTFTVRSLWCGSSILLGMRL